MSRGIVSMLSARSARSTPQQPPWGGDPRHAWYEGVLARSQNPGGGGDCKGISWQIVVPSTDASKENTGEATFALMWCQCVSCNKNVIEDPKER